jgi:parallel beta-helix repeat (two copies)
MEKIMKMKRLTRGRLIEKIFLSLLVVCISLHINATTYYVSNTGNDANTGLTTATPWKTLDKVNATTFKPGDQILFQKGNTFYGSITVKQSGTAGNPITFGAYGSGANPVITGFYTVPAWTNLGNNIWESTSTVSSLSECNMVTINGINTPMGRFPKVTDTNKGYYTYQSHSGQTSITSSNLTGTPNWTGAEVVIRNQAFHFKRSVVTSQSGSTLNFGDIGEGFSDGNGFFFQNDMRCVTQQNEWYFNSATKKIKIYSTTQPSNVNIANIENLITINANYLTFSNIKFTGSNGCGIYNPILISSYHHISIDNCIFSQIGVCAIYVNANYLSFTNNLISDCNISAIEATYGNHVDIKGNTIKDIGLLPGMRNNKVYTMCNAALDGGNVTAWTIKNNVIQNIGFNGISLWASDTVLIQNNLFDTFCSVLDDGAAIYTYSASGSTNHAVTITRNICLNGKAAVEGSAFVHHAHGIYLDQGSKNVTVSYNSCANNTGSGIYMNSAGNNTIRNNTCYNNSENQLSYQYFGGTAPIPTNDKFFKNLLISRNNGGTTLDFQKSLYIYFSNKTLILQAFTSDSNVYARPYADDKVFFVNQDVWANSFKTLADWQLFSGQDVHSKKSYQSVSNLNDLQFVYNETSANKTIALSQPMVDVQGARYSGNIILQPYTSLVLMKDNNPTEITSFTIPGQVGSSVINSTTGSISVTMPYGTSVASLAASFTLSSGASAKVGTTAQVSGSTTNNFSNSVVYVVTAQNGTTTKSWTVNVTVNSNNQAEISAFSVSDQIGNSIINSTTGSIGITVPYGTSVSNIAAIFTLSSGASAKVGTTTQISSSTLNDFTSPVVYVVTGQNGTAKTWTVTVTVNPPVVPSESEQIIDLKAGWNIVSFNVIPSSSDFNVIFKPLIQSGVLIKIQDEKGNFMVNTDYGWYSNLDTLDVREGYNVKVNADAQLIIKGLPVSPATISLNIGFNIIGFPFTKSLEALSTFQALINGGSLIKAQDEKGNFIIKTGSSWFNSIDSLQPGKGYYVIVNKNTSLDFSTLKSAPVAAQSQTLQSNTHFQKAFSGNPYASMNFIIRNLAKSNLNLKNGDEVGIFDGNACVGNFTYNGESTIGTSAGMNDVNSQISGFTPGDTIKFKIWRASNQVLVDKVTAIFLNNSSCIFASQGTAVVEMQARLNTEEPSVTQNVAEVKNYPNPFVDYTTFEFSLNESANVTLDIFDISGKKVAQLINQNYEPGVHTVKWDGKDQNGQTLNPGMYIYYYRAESYVVSKKLIYAKF